MIQTYTGENRYELRRELRQIVDTFVQEFGDLALERLDGEEADYEHVREALTSLPFLATKKLVVLRSPGAIKQFADDVERIISGIPETTDVVIVEPKLDKRLAYYKQLKKLTDFHEFAMPDSRSLVRFVATEAQRLGGSISGQDAVYLVERLGQNQQLIANEVQKLLLGRKVITRQTIDELTEPVPQSKIFDLLDAAFAGNHKKALTLYDEQRAQKISPQEIMGMLAWQLHILALVKSAAARASGEIASSAKLSPFVVTKTASLAERQGMTRIKELVTNLAAIDFASKTKTYDLDDALRNYILTM